MPPSPHPKLEQHMTCLLADVYACLTDIIAESNIDASYAQALHGVAQATYEAERAHCCLSLLPLLTCQVAGGDPHKAMPVAAAWRALHIAAVLLDDVEDGDVARMSNNPYSSAHAVNLATGFIALAGSVLQQLPRYLWAETQAAFNGTMLEMTSGQYADLTQKNSANLEQYVNIMAAKSGSCFAVVARAGARCATADTATLACFECFGYNVGMLIQVADDLVGFHKSAGRSDIATGQYTLPVHYAFIVATPAQRAQLAELLACAPDNVAAETRAKQMISMLGGDFYVRAELVRWRQRTMIALGNSVDPVVEALRAWVQVITSPALHIQALS